MNFKKIIISYDHRVEQKYIASILKVLDELGIEHETVDDSKVDNDYPILAKACYDKYLKSKADGMILLCGTGIGMNIVANKFKGIRSILAVEEFQAYFARMHENANCLVFGVGYTFLNGSEGDTKYEFRLCRRKMCRILNTFLSTGFEGGRHERRIAEIEKIEKQEL